jgi:hypothetical protein
MTRATMGGPAILPPGQIADPNNPRHKNVHASQAPGQESRSRIVTRRTPTNFGVVCLIDLLQRESAARMFSPPPAYDDDEAEEARREEAQAIADTRRHQHPLGG